MASMAPVARTIPITPPTMNTKKMMSAASIIPFGIEVRKAHTGSASASTRA